MRAATRWPIRRTRRLGLHMAAHPSFPPGPAWSQQQIAEALIPFRDELVDRLPSEIAASRGLTRDQHELIIDEAIDYCVTQYPRPITTQLTLDMAFWAAASYRVSRAHEQRGATVRAGWKRVNIDDVEIPSDEPGPGQVFVERL